MSTQSLPFLLKALRLPTMKDSFDDLAAAGVKAEWSYEMFLKELAMAELQGRQTRRIERQLKASNLPPLKTLETLETKKFPQKVRRQLGSLTTGGFMKNAENILIFGRPGTGKSHLASAIGHALIHEGHSVLFIPAYALVQKLLLAKSQFDLDRYLARLDRYDLVVIDDIGYVQQSRDEVEVLFTFFAERYERRSVIITSNLVFSEWDKIFKNPMTAAAAIDRLVHHSVILEMGGESYRQNAAKKKNKLPKEKVIVANDN